MTRGTWEEAGLMVLNGGLGAAGRIAPGMFWNAMFYRKHIKLHAETLSGGNTTNMTKRRLIL